VNNLTTAKPQADGICPTKSETNNMSKISFEDLEKQPAATEEKTLVTAESKQLATAVPAGNPANGLIGEWTAQDTRLPRLNLVNKSGELANTFIPGTYVINKEHQINGLAEGSREKSAPLNVIVASMAKQYQENIPFEERDAKPAQVFNSSSEVFASGGRIDRAQKEGCFSEIAHIELFIEQPETLDEDAAALFYNTLGGKKFARVIWTVSGPAFGAVAVTVASALRGHLSQTGIVGGWWHLSSNLIKGQKNSWWQPAIRTNGLTETKLREEVEAVLFK
jgi:hypothetical protein